MSIVLSLKAPLPPILLAYAELDPPQMQIQAGEMFAALCRAQNTCPDLLWDEGSQSRVGWELFQYGG